MQWHVPQLFCPAPTGKTSLHVCGLLSAAHSAVVLRLLAAEQELQLDTRQIFRRIQNVPALANAYQQYHQKRVQQGAGQRQQQQQQVPGQQPATGQLQQQQQQPHRQQLVQQH